MSIQITEEFDSPTGAYTNYDTWDPRVQKALKGRQHIDLRSFRNDVTRVRLFMYRLARPMADFYDITGKGLEMQVLCYGPACPICPDNAGQEIFRNAEQWSGGVGTGPDSSLEGRNSLRLDVKVGTTLVTTSTAEVVDLTVDNALLTGKDEDGDEYTYERYSLITSFPNFPGSKLDLANCQLALEDATGATQVFGFPTGQTSDGDFGWAIPYSELEIFQPTVVTFVLKTLTNCTVTVAAIRVIHTDWTATVLDMDTRTQRLVPIVDRDGSISDEDFPRMWRANDPPRVDLDPKPINAKLGVAFFTGSMTGTNRMTFYFRGRREDMLTQLDIDGVDEISEDGVRPLWGENQQSLRARSRQPDYGSAMYNPRAQADLDNLDQRRLSRGTDQPGQHDPAPGRPPAADLYMWQAELERVSDTVSESYVEARLTWGATNELYIGTSETLNDEDYMVFNLDGLLDANTQYLLSVDNVDNSVRVMIYPLTPEGGIIEEDQLFDSTAITNEFLIKRRKGRVGWKLEIEDGDVWVEGIRTRGLMFGEIITNNFESFTPVEGAQLYVGGTSDMTLTTNHNSYNEALIARDIHNTKSEDGSVKVTSEPLTGIESVWTTFDDFSHTQIVLDVWYPKVNLVQGQTLQAGLLNPKGFIVPIFVSGIVGDRWTSLTLRPTSAINEQTGIYKFVIMQSHGTATWWIDNLRINQQAIAWQGRATLNDPWNRFNNIWTEYHTYINADNYGAMFPERGTWLQVRGQALTQDAHIEKLYVKPKYSQLGRLTWDVGRGYRDVNR